MDKMTIDGTLADSGYGRRFVLCVHNGRGAAVELPWRPFWLLTQIAHRQLKGEWLPTWAFPGTTNIIVRIRDEFAKHSLPDPLINERRVGYRTTAKNLSISHYARKMAPQVAPWTSPGRRSY